jgi:integrase
MRRTLRVDRQLWTPRAGSPFLAPPKSKNSYRTVAISPLVADAVSAHLAVFGPGDSGLVFHQATGRPIVRAVVGKYMRTAATRAGLDGRTWHDLRHHHASVLLSAGVSPPLVAERLGHDLVTLLKTYAHVIRLDEDRVRSIVDETLGGSAEDWLRTEAI